MHHMREKHKKEWQRWIPLWGLKMSFHFSLWKYKNKYVKWQLYSGDDPCDGGVHQRGRAAGTSDQAKMTSVVILHMYNPLHFSPISECLFYTARMSWGVHPRPILTHAQRVCRMYKKVSMIWYFCVHRKVMLSSWQALRTTEDWAKTRHIFRFEACLLRARF